MDLGLRRIRDEGMKLTFTTGAPEMPATAATSSTYRSESGMLQRDRMATTTELPRQISATRMEMRRSREDEATSRVKKKEEA
jgi:hypothetical protein